METALKLVLPGQEVEPGILSYLREKDYRVEELDPEQNVDTYLDTFDWMLLKRRLSLRYRVTNGAAMYTLESIGPMDKGIAESMGTEIRLDRPVEVPARIPVKRVRKRVDGMIFPRKLLEQVQVRTERRRYGVFSPEGAEIDLAFDRTSISLRGLYKPRRAQKQNEMEIQLRKGSGAAIGVLSSLLSGKFGFLFSRSSKLEIAVERFKTAILPGKPPEELRVRLDDRLDLALRKILTVQSLRLREQLPGVHLDIDTEFVHQARVATRRMRSALRLFRNTIPDRTASFLEREMKWLGSKFGAVRDLDVFLLNLSRFKGRIERFPAKKKRAFESWIGKHRRAQLDALCQALQSQRYKTLESRLAQFLKSSLPLRPRRPLAMRPVQEVGPILISEKFDAVCEQGRTVLAKPKLKEFHRLRIQMKRFRYACEFMAPAYKGVLDSVIARTVEIQDCLGELQDAVFTWEFIDSLRSDLKGSLVDPDLLFILGEVYQMQGEIARERRAGFGEIWGRFSSDETLTLIKEMDRLQRNNGSSRGIVP